MTVQLNYSEAIKKHTAESYLTELQNIGWTKGMNEAVLETLKGNIQKYLQSACPCLVYKALASVAFETLDYRFDQETELAYTDVLHRLQKVMGSGFHFENILEQIDEPKCVSHISFSMGGRTYSAELDISYYSDTGIIHLANDALKESGSEKLLCYLHQPLTMPSSCKELAVFDYFCFIEPEVYARAVAKGLIDDHAFDGF